MSESKSDALPLGDIPMLERHPLNGHIGDYIMRQRILQSFFSEIRAFFQEGKVFPSRNANFTCHANRISTENRNLAGKMLKKAGQGLAPATAAVSDILAGMACHSVEPFHIGVL